MASEKGLMKYCSKAVVLRCSVKKVFLKVHNIHRKIPVLEFLFNKITDLRPATLLKRDPSTSVFLPILENF